MSHQEVSILLIEDDPIDVMAMKRGMKKHRVLNTLVVAENGAVGLEILRGQSSECKLSAPFVVLLDINMPVMNGLEFLKELRADTSIQATTVFVLTSSGHEKDIVSAYRQHVAGYILKQNLGDACVHIVEMLKAYWRIVELPIKE